MTDKKKADHTRCVGLPEGTELYDGALVTPIFQTTNFIFEKSQDLIDLQEGRGGGHLYTRYTNPGIMQVEKRVASLENGDAALLFASGMAATASACLALLQAGDRLLASRSLYGGTSEFFDKFLARFGVKVDYIAMEEFDHLEKHLAEPTRMIWFETPVNPTLLLLDIEQITSAARTKGVLTACDSTFGSPINQKPLDLGVDIVMHSVSKYIGGHSDVIGGVLVGSTDLMKKVWVARKLVGGSADPLAAFLVDRGMKTLAVRVERQNIAAQKIAEYLTKHPRIRQVFYPGLPNSPGYKIAKKQMSGFGGMVSFEVDGELDRAIKVIDAFKVILNATSLGGVESLASLPALTSQYALTPEERAEAGIPEGMIRLSVGLEDIDDLCADLDQALNA